MPAGLELELDVALFWELAATRPQQRRVPWDELIMMLTKHSERADRDGPGWSPARYRPDTTRANSNVEAVTAVVFDVDHREPEWWRLEGLEFAAHTTFKHHAGHADCGGRSDCPHWRVAVPLASPVPAERWGELWRQATAALCPDVDGATKDAARFYWLPVHQPGMPCDVRRGQGVPLDPARLLPEEARQTVDLDRPGDRFNRETDWATILEPAGWTRVPFNGDGERWRRPGKPEGISATTGGGGYDLFYVFSSNARPFEARTSYSKFAAFAQLQHGGDYGAAAAALGRQYRRGGPPLGLGAPPLRIGGAPTSPNGAAPDPCVEFTVEPFSVRRLRREDMRAHQWAHDGFFLVGALNALVGTGGAGKGTFMAHEIAQWTTGTLPGCFFGHPVKVLIIGDEDNADSDITPRIVAAGGDETMVRHLSYDQGQALNLIHHAAQLDEIVVKGGFSAVYFDQVLDHFDANLNSHTQHDVRSALSPLRGIARRRELMVAYTMHPNKISGQASIRDRGGGSGQFTDVSRSALYLGYHPDLEGWRAVARGKGNAGAVPPALLFRVEGTFVVNPETGEAIEIGQLVDLEPDTTGLKAHMILPHEPRKGEDEETGEQKLERVAQAVGADGEWHTRKELADACAAEDVSAHTFKRYFPGLTTVVHEAQRGQETRWRVKQ